MRRLIPIVERLFKYEGQQNSPATRNVRPDESIFPQDAPDPIRQTSFVSEGRVNSFPARQQVYTALQPGLFPATWEEDRFGGHAQDRLLTPNVGAWHIRGHQQEVGVRPNIGRPPSIAYGSLFTLPGGGN